ncbi:hypothetical protein CEE37_08230 [candidate division LCP-89 bacterium B3_LCP]|uniref:Beta-galactosidase n=1 Tax=candidate division LCP-89 bacterium B3_LCP TaxID=2012998 RepID=A0A532UZB8_UNCL8|nr:MAG: hypothetical protein CEE37_08230 [candidate division LCP-89 bacterium B3_LCP]
MFNLIKNKLKKRSSRHLKWYTWCLYLSVLTGLLASTAASADLSFFLSPENLKWSDYHPERSLDVAPVLNLCGEWWFRAGNDVGPINVPSCFIGYDGMVAFKRKIKISQEWAGKSLVIKVFGVQHRAIFKLNDALIGSFDGGQVPFDIPIDERLIRFDAVNELVVEVDNRKLPLNELPLKSSLFAPQNFGGMTRAIFLQALPPERVLSVKLSENNVSETSAIVQCLIDFEYNPERGPVELTLELFDQSGKHLADRTCTFEAEESGAVYNEESSFSIPSPKAWKSENPSFYRIKSRLTRGNVPLDEINNKFALRDLNKVENGFPVSWPQPFIGISRIAQWPQSGVSPSKRQLSQDIELLQELGATVVRNAFSPPHPYFLHLCDSLGIGLFVEIPLFGVSNKMLLKSDVKRAAFSSMLEMQSLADEHPCILALGWGSNLEPEVITEGGIITSWIEELPSQIPYYVHTIGTPERDPEFTIMIPSEGEGISTVSIPEIPAFEKSRGSGNNVNKQVTSLVKNEEPFFLSCFNDWHSSRPILTNPLNIGPYQHTEGLVFSSRKPKDIFYQLSQSIKSPVIEPVSLPPSEREELPWQFLSVGLLFSAIGLWMMRSDKLLRQNLHRSFSHSLGFFSDIRDRRFLQGTETLFILIFAGIGLGNLSASLSYELRANYGLSALMEHLIPVDLFSIIFRSALWQPFYGVLLNTVVILALLFGGAVMVRLFSPPYQNRITVIQSLHLIFWAGVPMLLVLPISSFYIRLENVVVLKWIILIIALWMVLWSYLRLLSAINVCFRRNFVRPVIIGLVLPMSLILLYIISLQFTKQTLYYTGYFIQLFKGG